MSDARNLTPLRALDLFKDLPKTPGALNQWQFDAIRSALVNHIGYGLAVASRRRARRKGKRR